MDKKNTLKRIKIQLQRISVFLVFLMVCQVHGQVSNYDFSQRQANYSTLVNPTTIIQASDTQLENKRYSLNLPFGFTFNEVVYNQMFVHSSGFITFGTNAPFGATPISNSVTVYEGAIAALAAPITARYSSSGAKGKISYKVEGNQPNRVLVIQWENFGYFDSETQSASRTYNLNFQIRLSEDGTISTVYDLSALGVPDNFSAQVGLRGRTTADFNNRYAIGNTAANNLATTVAGTSNASVVYMYKDFLPTSGLTLSWAPSNFCLPVFEYGANSEMITHVLFNTIDKTSPFQSGTTPVYEDFRTVSTDLQKGNTYPISVKGPAGSFSSDVMVYIDFNRNGRYDDDGEGFYLGKIEPGNPANAKTVSGSIVIPTTALTGSTGMRIIKNSGLTPANSITNPCASNLRAGQVEDYTVNILGADTTPEPTCNNAEPGLNPGDTGCITLMYQGVNVVYTTVRAKDGNIWIQQNLGSPAVATSSTDADNYGDLFQWGRWDDGHQLRTSPSSTTALTPNNPMGLNGGMADFINTQPTWWENAATVIRWEASTPQEATADNGCDPCKALGSNWNVPTESQWQSIIQAETITNIQTAFDSNLKLTVAGFRGSSNGIASLGVRGYYWSKTPSATNSSFQKYLYYSNLTMNTGAGAFRSQGSSVRCIKLAGAIDPVFPAPYCGVDGVTTSTVSEITEVSLAGVVKTSSMNEPNMPLIENFTTTVFELSKEVAYPIKVKGGTQGQSTVSVYAYIDWNHNNTFDSDEVINLGFLTNTGTVNGQEMGELLASITIPSTALLGQTRLRLVKAYESTSSMGTLVNLPCPTGWFIGQVEDYTININPAAAVPNAESLVVSVENNQAPSINTTTGTLQLVAQITPANARQNVTWSIVSGQDVVAINANGLVAAVADGTAVIRATSVENTSVFGEITITVSLPVVCPQPIAASVHTISTQSAVFVWDFTTSIEVEPVFEYEVRTHGAPGSQIGLVQRGETNEFNVLLNGLLFNTTYMVYVRTKCDTDLFSHWTNGFEFVTQCTVIALPIVASQNFCGDKTVADLRVNGQENASFNWYATPTGTAALTGNTRLVSRTYYVSQTVRGCESARVAVEVVVAAGITTPRASNQSFCFTNITVADLVATADTGAQINWYNSIDAVNPLALTQRVTSGYYYVSQKIGSCESTRLLINISVIANTTAPQVMAQSFCGSAVIGDLRTNLTPGMQARWYRISEGGNFLSNDVSLTTGVYYVAQGWNGCESPRTAVTVTIHTIPEKPVGEISQEIAHTGTLSDITVIAENPIWYNSKSDAQYDRNRISPQTTVISNMTYYVVNQSLEGCQSEPLGITVITKLKREDFDADYFSYYPNPTTDYIWVKYLENIKAYTIFDSNGKQIAHRIVNASQLQMDFRDYAAGVYLIYLTTENKQQTIRVVKR